MSNFAFGTYRISDLNPAHIQALKQAIDSDIKMIDTSPSYLDGGAERAIALAFRGYEDKIDDIEIVSKFVFSDVLIEEQLTQSLKNLERDKIGCYLIQNPETYLLEAVKKGIDKDKRLDEMYIIIESSFVELEEEVKKGRIGSYGICSDSFSKENTSDEFLPYEDLITLAQNAAVTAGNENHSFTTIQLPINILETHGLKCASWAKKNSLRILANRVLTAQKDNLMYRLCDYDEPYEYYHHLNELMDVCDNDMLKPMFTLLEQLDESKHKFGWIGDYDTFLYAQIIPHMRKTLEVIDEKNRDTMFNFIDLFLSEYKKMVAYECSKNTRIQLKEYISSCETLLEICAINFLKQRENVDYILVGMRKASYVDQVLALEV